MIAQHKPPLIVITGPTATGKTRTAAHLARAMNGEIISADSRQVFRGMDIGTGKDLDDFLVDDYLVPYHLVDIVDPGHEFSVFEFLQHFTQAYNHVSKREKQPILCGGTGLYIEAALKGYKMLKVPENTELRKKLNELTMQELTDMLRSFRPLHNISDTSDRERLLRAIEIETHQREHPEAALQLPDFRYVIFAIHFERDEIRRRITQRLHVRLQEGMIDEIHRLLNLGLKPEQLTFYGLEYRYLTLYAIGEISYDEMIRKLNTAIHQFAKRQMTWFRRMERNGFNIHWIDGNYSMETRVALIRETLKVKGV
jgi:tRNA dimethylallyltransferase